MDNHLAIVEQYPARRGLTFNVQPATAGLGGPLVHLVHDRFKLGRAVGVAQHKVIGQQGDVLHIQENDVRAKAFSNSIDDGMSEFERFQGQPPCSTYGPDRIRAR